MESVMPYPTYAELNKQRDYWNSRTLQAKLNAPSPARPAPTAAQIDARKAGRAAGRREAAEIARLCAATGRPELAAAFLLDGKRLSEVQAELAAQSASPPGSTADAGVSAIVAHLNRLTPEAIERMWDRAFAEARRRVA
jgi:hypothetical protein